MPLHDHRCLNCGVIEERVVAVADLAKPQYHKCGYQIEGLMERVFLQPVMGFVQRDICYDSPIDGRAITNKHARQEDLRRNECVEYEPGMKQDAARERNRMETALERAVDSTVDEFFATAPARITEKLEQELRAGASVEVTRASPETLH